MLAPIVIIKAKHLIYGMIDMFETAICVYMAHIALIVYTRFVEYVYLTLFVNSSCLLYNIARIFKTAISITDYFEEQHSFKERLYIR